MLPLQVSPSAQLAERALTLGIERQMTAYDAAYLALADLLDVPLVTADEALVRKSGGPSDRLMLLSNL